jgi:hypothetical protein
MKSKTRCSRDMLRCLIWCKLLAHDRCHLLERRGRGESLREVDLGPGVYFLAVPLVSLRVYTVEWMREKANDES